MGPGFRLDDLRIPRVKHGAGLVKPGMTIKVKGLLTQCTRTTPKACKLRVR
jgi:hypothetical protein